CPECGKRTQTPVANSGRRARCGRCGEVFVVPSPEDEGARPTEPAPPKRLVTDVVSFDCRVCGTRLTAPTTAVGKKVRCPDCGALTVAPKPPPPKKANIPAAMFEDSYEVYEDEVQPTAEQLQAGLPKTIPVHCEQCQTLMHARQEQVGGELICPDCGTRTRVRAPVAAKPMIDVARESYDVHAAAEHDTPNDAVRALIAEGQRQAEEEAAASPERPELPAAPLLQGVLRMLLRNNIGGRFAALSLVFMISLSLFAYAIPAFNGIGGGKVAMAAGAVMGVCLAMLASLMMVIALGFLAALVITIVTESSEGNDHLQTTPSPNPTDWFGEALTLGLAFGAAAAPGWIVGMIAGGGAMAVLGGGVSLVLLFPMVLLSQLDLGSPFALVSPALLAAAPRVLGSLLLLWIQSALLAAAVVAALVPLSHLIDLYALPLVAPLALAAALLYFRLVGRLAWLVAERTGQ
ncbi:MAG: hypothetical protein AAGJ46_20985, partial [Planctomycetota bacterium]